MRRLFTSTLLLATLATSAHAQSGDQRTQLTAKFRAKLTEIARNTEGVVGLSVIDLKSGERFGVNDTLRFPQGSAIKIPILVTLYAQAEAGVCSLEEKVPLKAADQVAGTGVAQYFSAGQSMLSLHDLAVLMIALSDNAATNVLIEKDRGMAPASTRRRPKLDSARSNCSDS